MLCLTQVHLNSNTSEETADSLHGLLLILPRIGRTAMTHRTLGRVFTVILLNCIQQGNFKFGVVTLVLCALSAISFGFQRAKLPLGEVMILSVCIPADSMQYPLRNVSDIVCSLFSLPTLSDVLDRATGC